jgi:hypothetical protein
MSLELHLYEIGFWMMVSFTLGFCFCVWMQDKK